MASFAKAVSGFLIAAGLYGSYREACGGEGWGSFILVALGILVLTLIRAGEDGLPLRTRAARLLVGILVFVPLSIAFQPIFQDVIRPACGP